MISLLLVLWMLLIKACLDGCASNNDTGITVKDAKIDTVIKMPSVKTLSPQHKEKNAKTKQKQLMIAESNNNFYQFSPSSRSLVTCIETAHALRA